MNLQKEREAFEDWHYEQYLLENPNVDIANAKYIYDYAHKNALVCQLKESHFIAWQAAKAQAIPDGFVAVPDEPTERMLDSAYSSISDNLHYADLENIYKAMIWSAQEPTND